jgi:1-acyl-sn-glycerol-3-phosphate acyltransferase
MVVIPGAMLKKALLLPYHIYAILFFFPLMFFCGLCSYLVGFFDASGHLAHRCLTHWARINLALAGLRVYVEGKERLDPKKPYVFMLNHASFLDILLAFAYIPCDFRIIVKKEAFSIPFIGLALKNSREIPMDRNNPRKGLKSLKEAARLLKDGVSIVVFPEGTRTPNGEIQDFKVTLFSLPIRSRIPVAPVLIEGTFRALKRGSMRLDPVPLKLTFHKPIPATSFKDRDRGLYAEKVWKVLSS